MTGFTERFTTAVTGPDVARLPRVFHPVGVSGFSHRWIGAAIDGPAGTVVTQWKNQTSAVDFAANSGAPKLGIESNMRFVKLDGVADRMVSATVATAQPFTVAMIARVSGLSATPKMLLNLNSSNITVTDTYISPWAGTGFTAPALTPGWHLVMVTFSAAASTVAVDGITRTGNTGAAGAAALTLGLNAASVGLDVAELLVWPTALTADQMNTVRAALKAQYPVLP